MRNSLLLLLTLMLTGCDVPSMEKPTRDRPEASIYITMFENELLGMNRLNSKAITPLTTAIMAATDDKRSTATLKELLKTAKKQIETASQVLDAKEIPADLPQNIREELLTAKSRVRKTYQIKQESLDYLAQFIKTKQPELLQKYQKLSMEAKHTLDEANASINRARSAAR